MKAFVIAIAVLVSGCRHAPMHQRDVYLPQMPPAEPGLEEVWLTAGGSGYLVIDRNCVRLKSDVDNQLSTIFWHRAFGLAHDAKMVAIKSSKTGNLYPIGTHMKIGGGILSEDAARRIDPVAVAKCGGPFASGWIDE